MPDQFRSEPSALAEFAESLRTTGTEARVKIYVIRDEDLPVLIAGYTRQYAYAERIFGVLDAWLERSLNMDPPPRCVCCDKPLEMIPQSQDPIDTIKGPMALPAAFVIVTSYLFDWDNDCGLPVTAGGACRPCEEKLSDDEISFAAACQFSTSPEGVTYDTSLANTETTTVKQ